MTIGIVFWDKVQQDNPTPNLGYLIKNLWGYCSNGTLFIMWNDDFNRIPVIGSICHFIADQTVYHQQYYDPYYSSYYYPMSPQSHSTKELRQYITALLCHNHRLAIKPIESQEMHMKLSSEEIKKQIESSFAPCSCTAEIWDHGRQIKVLISDTDGNEIYEADSWLIGELSEKDDLNTAIERVRIMIEGKKVKLDQLPQK